MLQESRCLQLLWLCSAVPTSLMPPLEIVNLNWSCKVLAGHPHKIPQKGFLPYLQPKESAQIDSTALIQVLLEKNASEQITLDQIPQRIPEISWVWPGAENDAVWLPFHKNSV